VFRGGVKASGDVAGWVAAAVCCPIDGFAVELAFCAAGSSRSVSHNCLCLDCVDVPLIIAASNDGTLLV
jgi:hypothetical protein